MSRIIILDSGPLAMVTNPQAKPPYLECQLWLDSLLQNGEMVILPEIADYEVRRELIRAGKERGIRKLDLFKNVLTYRPLTTEVMLLAAQAILEASEGNEVLIATTNVGHLSQFVDAREWRLIQ